MNLINVINQFYFDMTINELRLMNTTQNFPNITYNSLLYLDIIAYKENCTVSFLSNAMNVAKSAVTLKINELVSHGLVLRTQSTEDKRVYYLTVQQKVIEEYKIYDKALHNAIQSIEKKYTKKEIDTLCEIIQIISKCFSEETDNDKKSTS